MNDASRLTMDELLLYVHGAAAIQLLRSGVELKVFDLLHQHDALTIDEINAHVRIDQQSLRTLFMGLLALRLVERKDGKYSNAPAIDGLFRRNEWTVFTSLVLFQAYIVYPGQVDYLESLVVGQNVGIRRYGGQGHTLYEKFRFDPRTKHIFYLYMNQYSTYAIPHVLKQRGLRRDPRVLDVGGGGSNSVAIASARPQGRGDAPGPAGRTGRCARRRSGGTV